jgi:hypothetical protein
MCVFTPVESRNRAVVMLPSALDSVRVYTRRGLCDHSLAILVVDIFQVVCVNMAGQIAEFVSSACFHDRRAEQWRLMINEP